jgi:hypothetical protein
MSKYTVLLEPLAADVPLATTIDGISTTGQDWDLDAGLATLGLDPMDQERLNPGSVIMVTLADDTGTVVMAGSVMFL